MSVSPVTQNLAKWGRLPTITITSCHGNQPRARGDCCTVINRDWQVRRRSSHIGHSSPPRSLNGIWCSPDKDGSFLITIVVVTQCRQSHLTIKLRQKNIQWHQGVYSPDRASRRNNKCWDTDLTSEIETSIIWTNAVFCAHDNWNADGSASLILTPLL